MREESIKAIIQAILGVPVIGLAILDWYYYGAWWGALAILGAYIWFAVACVIAIHWAEIIDFWLWSRKCKDEATK